MGYNDTKGWQEDKYEDFQEFLEKGNWAGAKVIIEAFEEAGLATHWELRKELAKAQYESTLV